MAPKAFGTIPKSEGLSYWYNALTNGTASQMTGGRIPKMNPTQASAFLGAMTGEHGKLDWNGMDVVEAGSGRGRGAAQYTGVRRTPYDQARAQALAAGKDPNSAQWQFEYFTREYMNKDLIGWTKVFEKMPNFKNVQEGVMYFTGSAQEGKGYFRPDKGSAHYDKRINFAQQIQKLMTAGEAAAPKPTTPSKTQGTPNLIDGVLQKLGIKGGAQSFNTNKLQQVVGSIAANMPASDVGLAIFASQKGIKNPMQQWKSLDSATRKAWATAGNTLAISSNPNYYASNQTGGSGATYTMPKTLSIGPGTKSYQTSSIGSTPDFLQDNSYRASAANQTYKGGLPSLNDVAQAGIANYSHFKNQSSSYGINAYRMGSSTIGRINSQSYGTSLDLGRSLGITGGSSYGSITSAGSSYGGTAFSSSFNAGGIAASSYGYSQ